MTRPALLAAVLVLAAPSAALAADPVPGATYEGTTDTGTPFSLKVSSDGSAVTEIKTAATLTCSGAEGGTESRGIFSDKQFPITSGSFEGTDEDASPRLDPVKGEFTSASQVTGTIRASLGRFTPGVGLSTCNKLISYTASTTSAAEVGDDGPPALTLTAPRTAALATVLRSGLPVRGTIGRAGRLVAVARLSAKAARRYGVSVLARRAARVDRGRFTLTLRPTARVARRLRDAGALRVVVTLTGAGTTRKRTIALT